MRAGFFLLFLVAAAPSLEAQVAEPLRGIARFPVESSGLVLSGPARSGVYVAELGRRAALLGDETGSFEAWTWPLKLVRDLRLAFKVPEYDEPITAASVARQVIVRPEATSIIYSHPSFTVRQHLLVPLEEPGALILLEVETARRLDILVRMQAELNLAWPGSFGGGYISWLGEQNRFLLSQGGVRQYNAFIGSPFAVSGTAHPAHDAPTTPSQFVLRFDPARTNTDFLPIIIAGGATPRDSVSAVYDRLLANAARYWQQKVEHYQEVQNQLLTIDSPESLLDQALAWSKVNLDQQLVCNPDLGCGLAAGFGAAGPGNYRPGFGWYFGGDAAINSFAMSALGQFELVQEGLGFLAQYQRADGKIPHEISHAAKRLPWFTDFPYTWFHGDTTPFWVLACYVYWSASGDDAFLREHWERITRAFAWSAATDTNGDGLMDNSAAGAGAIEVGGLGENLLTDIYLAGVWLASLEAVSSMAASMGDTTVAERAGVLVRAAQRGLEQQFWLDSAGIYAFALLQPNRNEARSQQQPRVNNALTVWPATAMAFGLLDAGRSDRMLREIGSSAITADWGARMLSRYHRLYDPLHYNNGTVWPFVSGFASLAHYRYHRAWAGYDLMRDIARATFDFARGRTPELFSGAFYQMLDTAVPQQFFASSMFVTPLVRGLIGWETDAANRAAALEPHLPPGWRELRVENLRVGRDRLAVTVRRDAGTYSIHVRRLTAGPALTLRLSPALPLGARIRNVVVNDRDVPAQAEESAHDVHAVIELQLESEAQVDIDFEGGMEIVAPEERLNVGDASESLKVLDFRRDGREYLLLVEGLGGRSYDVDIYTAVRPRNVQGGEITKQVGARFGLRIGMPADTGFVRKSVRLRP